MSRQESLEIIWKKLVIVIIMILLIMVMILIKIDEKSVLGMMFIAGNLGGYVAIHKNLSDYSNEELYQLSKSWFGILLPPIIGGILSMVLYLIFISGLISGSFFPTIVADRCYVNGFGAILQQHAEGPSEYAKLLFWGFVAGFNEKYVTNIIDSIRQKSLTE